MKIENRKLKTVVALLLVLGLAGRCFGVWVLPTSYSDPNGKWTSETSAYDANLTTKATNTVGKDGNNINFFHSGVTDCNKVRVYLGIAAGRTGACDVNYGNVWYSVFAGAMTNGWNTYEIGSSQTITGVRFRATSSGTLFLYEVHFWQPSTAKPTKVTNLSPANSGTNIDIKTLLSWLTGNMMDTDSYKVYLGTDVNATNIINGENDTVTTYDPLGLPPSITYYWRIDAKNDYDVNTGDIWSFTTRVGYKTFMP